MDEEAIVAESEAEIDRNAAQFCYTGKQLVVHMQRYRCYITPLESLSKKKRVIMANTASALHILVDDEKQANDILAQIEQGADFQDMARKYSNCPSKRDGGSLGEFRKGDMVPAFDKVVFSCELLKPAGPVKTQFGYHLIKVLYRN